MSGAERIRGAGPGFRFEAKCAWCGPVAVEYEGLHVFVSERGAGLFEFQCPWCHRGNYRSLSISDLEALSLAGVLPGEGRAPFELLEERSGPPIGWDDLLDFHQALSGDGDGARGLDRRSGSRAMEQDAA